MRVASLSFFWSLFGSLINFGRESLGREKRGMFLTGAQKVLSEEQVEGLLRACRCNVRPSANT